MAHHYSPQSPPRADCARPELNVLDDEQLGQLALKNARPADRDDHVWDLLCAEELLPRVFSVLLAMKGRNAAAIAARRLSRRSDNERRANVRAQREWLSRAEKFGRRVDATLAALHAEHPQVASACGYQPGPE